MVPVEWGGGGGGGGGSESGMARALNRAVIVSEMQWGQPISQHERCHVMQVAVAFRRLATSTDRNDFGKAFMFGKSMPTTCSEKTVRHGIGSFRPRHIVLPVVIDTPLSDSD